jgi:hypothetical protein
VPAQRVQALLELPVADLLGGFLALRGGDA